MWIGRPRHDKPRHEERCHQHSNDNIDQIVETPNPARKLGRDAVHQASAGSALLALTLAARIHPGISPLRLFILSDVAGGLNVLPEKLCVS